MTGLRALARLWWVAFLVVLLPRPAAAHEFRPIVLELRELEHGAWRVHLEVPPASDARVGAPIEVTLPAHCVDQEPALGTVDCGERGLTGVVGLRGLAGQRADGIVRIHRVGGGVESHALRPGAPTIELGEQPHPGVLGYVGLGVTHILGGFDHLLFVLALVLLGRPARSGAARRLALSLTGFTVGHSLTLALAVLDLVQVPAPPLEACIALSIALVAGAALREGEPVSAPSSVTSGLPVAVVFGLLHGLGFAGALREVGLPSQGLGGALFGFNVGVELGQLLLLALLLLLAAAVHRLDGLEDRVEQLRGRLVRAVGTVGMAWVFIRVASFWEVG